MLDWSWNWMDVFHTWPVQKNEAIFGWYAIIVTSHVVNALEVPGAVAETSRPPPVAASSSFFFIVASIWNRNFDFFSAAGASTTIIFVPSNNPCRCWRFDGEGFGFHLQSCWQWGKVWCRLGRKQMRLWWLLPLSLAVHACLRRHCSRWWPFVAVCAWCIFCWEAPVNFPSSSDFCTRCNNIGKGYIVLPPRHRASTSKNSVRLRSSGEGKRKCRICGKCGHFSKTCRHRSSSKNFNLSDWKNVDLKLNEWMDSIHKLWKKHEARFECYAFILSTPRWLYRPYAPCYGRVICSGCIVVNLVGTTQARTYDIILISVQKFILVLVLALLVVLVLALLFSS